MNLLIKKLSKQEYYREYIRKRDATIFCEYCNIYCTKRDKHYNTDDHMRNIAHALHLNIDLLINSK